MPPILTTLSLIQCPHGGQAKGTPKSLIWSIMGGTTFMEDDTGTIDCPFKACPCETFTLKSMRLTGMGSAGKAPILKTDFNQTNTDLPLMITLGEDIFSDSSTPEALPDGEAGPRLTPAMADLTRPVVVAAVPAIAFNSLTMQPATIPVVFTLAATYPWKWVLTLLNGVAHYHLDLTQGLVGAMPVPAGGSWKTVSLVVTLTLTAPFMAGLGVGLHQIFMTGVSQRGLPNFALVALTVT